VSGVWLRDLVKALKDGGIDAEGLTYKYGRYAGKRWDQVGWNNQGYRQLRGIMWHHDASPQGPSPGALSWCMTSSLAPCGAIWVDMQGKWWVFAAGLTNHAGLGSSPLAPNNSGNSVYLGIECDHTLNEPWPREQLDSIRRGTAVLMKHYKLDPAKALEFHKSYAPGRKNDPDRLDLKKERRRVARLMKSNQRGIKAALNRWFLLDRWLYR
jgi:hypothetical protein